MGISVAVATPKGLVVPVLRNVERMNYADIEKGIAELGKKAKNNQISIERPVVRNGQVVIRPMMYIALTYDHRLVDGREAVTFLRTIKNAVKDPRIMLMDL